MDTTYEPSIFLEDLDPSSLALSDNDQSHVIVIGRPSENLDDPVNHPKHYTKGGIECIDAIRSSMTDIEYAGYLKGNILKYLWRYRNKNNPVEDLEKAIWYLNRLHQLNVDMEELNNV